MVRGTILAVALAATLGLTGAQARSGDATTVAGPVPTHPALAPLDALVSDYHIPALALAAWTLVDRGLLDLPRAWALISEKPADILRLPDRGKLNPGLRADLVVVNAETRAIEATIAGGRLTYLAGEAGCRFLSQPQALRMAAE